MNVQETKQGLLTFVITLIIASGVFFSMYLAINKLNSQATLETNTASNCNSQLAQKENSQVKGVATVSEDTYSETPSQNTEIKEKKTSVFASMVDSSDTYPSTEKTALLTSENAYKQTGSVLAAGTTNRSTPGSVPVTGTESTIGLLVLSATLIVFGIYMYAEHARKNAIKAFERDIVQD